MIKRVVVLKRIRRIPKEMRKQRFSGVRWGRKPCGCGCKGKKEELKVEPAKMSIFDFSWKEAILDGRNNT